MALLHPHYYFSKKCPIEPSDAVAQGMGATVFLAFPFRNSFHFHVEVEAVASETLRNMFVGFIRFPCIFLITHVSAWAFLFRWFLFSFFLEFFEGLMVSE
jgi:hypothetical protein